MGKANNKKEGITMKLGALEAGGTKMVCAIGDETGKIYEQVSIATTTPEETIPKLIAYFQDKQIDALTTMKLSIVLILSFYL